MSNQFSIFMNGLTVHFETSFGLRVQSNGMGDVRVTVHDLAEFIPGSDAPSDGSERPPGTIVLPSDGDFLQNWIANDPEDQRSVTTI